jgi:hypothetical protein
MDNNTRMMIANASECSTGDIVINAIVGTPRTPSEHVERNTRNTETAQAIGDRAGARI